MQALDSGFVPIVGRVLLITLLWGSFVLTAQPLSDRAEHGYVNNKGVKIHYVSLGEGPLVVFLHGYPDYWYTWRGVMEPLSQTHQVVAVDLRGYNLSDKPVGVENYTMRNLIGDAAAVITHFPHGRATLVGHDWGGAIAWQVAMWRPELVERLAVLSTPHPNGLFRELRENPDQQRNSEYARKFQEPDARLGVTPADLAAWVTDDVARPYYLEAFERSDVEAMLNYYKASFPRPASTTPSATVSSSSQQRRVACPTMVIFGLQDRALLPSGFNATWEWIDNTLTMVALPEAGHFVQQDDPEAVLINLSSFLKPRHWLER